MEVETGEMEVLDNVNASPTCEGSDVASDFESGRNKRAKAPCNNKQCRSYTPRLSGSESCCGRDKREEPKINQGESHTAVVSTQSTDKQLHSRRCRTLPSPRRRRARGQTGNAAPSRGGGERAAKRASGSSYHNDVVDATEERSSTFGSRQQL